MDLGVPEWPQILDEQLCFERDEEGDWWMVGLVLHPDELLPRIEVMPLPDVEDDDE